MILRYWKEILIIVNPLIIVAYFTFFFKVNLQQTQNISNTQYQNQSQWQATLVFPQKMQSITVDKFTVKWVPESDNLFSSYRWEPSFAELNAKCLYWTAFRNPDNNTEVYVNCIKEKTKFMKKEKVGNVTED